MPSASSRTIRPASPWIRLRWGEAAEHARFRIEATDGGFGPTAPPDRFAFAVFFDSDEAPVNHAIFGPEVTFTGEMIAGKITIGPPSTEEVSAATLAP